MLADNHHHDESLFTVDDLLWFIHPALVFVILYHGNELKMSNIKAKDKISYSNLH